MHINIKIGKKRNTLANVINEEITNVINEQEEEASVLGQAADKEKPQVKPGEKIENVDYNPALAKLLQTTKEGISIAEFLYNLGKGMLPRDQLGAVFELKSILKNNKATRNRRGRALVFVMDTLLNDMIAVAKTKKDKNASYTIVRDGKKETKKYASKILKNDARKKLGEALVAMTAALSIDPDHPKFKEIYNKKQVNEAWYDSFFRWVQKFLNDIWEFITTPVASTFAYVESVIRAPETILRQAASVLGIGEQRKQMAAAVVYPDWKITIGGRKVPLGHAAMLLIFPKGKAEEGKEQQYELKAYEFGRYTAGADRKGFKATYGVSKGELARTKKELGYSGSETTNSSLGVKRSKKISTPFKFEWNAIGQLTNETQINIVNALRNSGTFGKYARGSYTRVAWLMDIDPKKAEAEANRFDVRPYGALWLGAGSEKGDFGYFGTVKDGKDKGKRKWIKTGAMGVENCATFVATCLQAANKNVLGKSLSATLRRQALAHPNAMISALANELDEEVTSYGTGNKTSTNVNTAWKILGTDSEGKDWADKRKADLKSSASDILSDPIGTPEEFLKARRSAYRKIKPGSAIAGSGKRAGATPEGVYRQLEKAIPEEILSRPEFRRWNSGRPGGKTKRLLALYQSVKGIGVDGRCGSGTWEALSSE